MNAKEPKIIIVGGKPVYDIRAFYRKEGRAKYISHLDLYRTVQRAFQRSKLPIWFTLGFNPHIYLTYALPLALGYEGVRESFDFRLTEDLPLEEAAARLNAAMPEGIVITELAPPVRKADDIEKADYTLEFSMKELSPEELADQEIRPNTIRLSIGTEHIEDILEDLQMGFHAAEQMGLDAAGAEMPEKMEERS